MTSGSWDDGGVNTTSIRAVEVEEYKSYEVECSSYRTSAQVVLVDIPSPIQVNIHCLVMDHNNKQGNHQVGNDKTSFIELIKVIYQQKCEHIKINCLV